MSMNSHELILQYSHCSLMYILCLLVIERLRKFGRKLYRCQKVRKRGNQRRKVELQLAYKCREQEDSFLILKETQLGDLAFPSYSEKQMKEQVFSLRSLDFILRQWGLSPVNAGSQASLTEFCFSSEQDPGICGFQPSMVLKQMVMVFLRAYIESFSRRGNLLLIIAVSQ